MYKIEYRVVVETSGNNIGYHFLRGNDITGWKNVRWNELSINERETFIDMLNQGVNLFNKILYPDNTNKQSTNDKYHLDKHIWEGWTIGDFIDSLTFLIETIMNNDSWEKPFANKKQLARWCMDNQPYYKNYIPEVVDYFADKYNIK